MEFRRVVVIMYERSVAKPVIVIRNQEAAKMSTEKEYFTLKKYLEEAD